MDDVEKREFVERIGFLVSDIAIRELSQAIFEFTEGNEDVMLPEQLHDAAVRQIIVNLGSSRQATNPIQEALTVIRSFLEGKSDEQLEELFLKNAEWFEDTEGLAWAPKGWTRRDFIIDYILASDPIVSEGGLFDFAVKYGLLPTADPFL